MSYLPDSPMSATGKRGASDDTLVLDRTKATRYIMLPKKDMHLWPRVRTRTTYDEKTGGLIARHTVKDMTEEELRAPLPDGPCDIHVIFELDKEPDGKPIGPRDSDEETKVVVPEPSASEEEQKRIADLEALVSEAVEGADVGALPPSKVGKGDKESPRPSGNRPAGSLEPEGVAQHAEGRIEPVAPLSLPHLESSAEKAVKIVTPEEEATLAEKESRQHELARQAKSVTHSFCHRFNNPHYKHCARANAQNAPCKKGTLAMGPMPKDFGESTTGDTLVSRKRKEGLSGVPGNRLTDEANLDAEIDEEDENRALDTLDAYPGAVNGLVMYDRATDVLMANPTATRKEGETEVAFRKLQGADQVKSFYCDNAPELKKAADKLG